jgi:hypothetical protein
LATADRTLDDEAELPRPKARARKKAEESTPARSEPARSEPARGERPRAVPAEEEGRRHEVLGLFALAGTILTGLALFSYDAREVGNAIGFVGQSIASVLATAFGVAAWFVPLELALLTGRLFRRSRSPLGLARLASTVVVVLIGCAMVHLAMPEQEVMGGHLPGGLLGEVLGELMRSLFGLVGAFVVGFTMLLVTMVLRTSLSVVGMGKQVAGVAKLGGEKAKEGIGQVATALREAREIELREREEERLRNQPKIVVGASSAGAVPAPIPPAAKTDKLDKSDVADKARGKKKPAPVAEVETEDAEAAEVERDGLTDTDPDGALEAHDDEDEASADDEVDDAIDDADERVVVATVGKEVSGLRKSAKAGDVDAKASGELAKVSGAPTKASDEDAKASRGKKKDSGPTIVPPTLGAPKEAAASSPAPSAPSKKNVDDFVLPPTTLLDAPKAQAAPDRREAAPRQRRAPRGEARRVRRARSGRRDPPRPRRHDVRARARERHEGLEDRRALGRSRDGARRAEGPHRRAHPRQGARGLRAAEQAPSDGGAARDPRGHALEREQERAARGLRQGHRRSAGLRRSREDAPLARRWRDRRGQERGPQRDARVAPHEAHARRRAPLDDRPEGGRARGLRRHPAHALAGRHRHEEGERSRCAGPSTRWSAATSSSPTRARATSSRTTSGSRR